MNEQTTTTTTTTVRTTTTDESVTRVALLIDESGSMLGIKAVTLSTVNEYLDSLRALPGRVLVTLVFFNSVNSARVVYKDRPVGTVSHITPADYNPDQWTPLYDAVGKTIFTMELEGAGKAPTKVLFVIQTDGMENQSTEYRTAAQIRAVVKAREAQGWTFIYLGADLSKAQSETAANAIGISAGNTMSYEKRATRETFGNLASATANYHANQGAQQASSDFWSENSKPGKPDKASSNS